MLLLIIDDTYKYKRKQVLDIHYYLWHTPSDEIRVKGRGMIVWMGLALMVSTRLWLGGKCAS
jgi:hypothetical protein